MTDAIVLGGGGSKGAFGVGVLLRLYELGIRPGVIFGASAGALNALKLAEAPQNSLQPQRIRKFGRARTAQTIFICHVHG